MLRTVKIDAGVLTRRELEIVELAASGASNQEIARGLWLTRRTVEFHLTNAYRKLGLQRRGQLAAALAGRRCYVSAELEADSGRTDGGRALAAAAGH